MAHEFHAGEHQVQQRAGEAAIAQRNAAVVGRQVIPGARAFLEKQPWVALAHEDAQGRLWADLLFGPPGFLRSSGDGSSLVIDAPPAQRQAAAWAALAPHARLGLLAIELGTRRRYRINGRVQSLHDAGLQLAIDEAYPNCPKYIQRRHLGGAAELQAPTAPQLASDAARDAVLAQADTLFMATGAPDGGLDASHRGGPVGFIECVGERRLRVPDYAGNSLFNTLGNLALDPRCGLAVPDFSGGRLLQLSGRAELLWDQPDPQNRSGGTGRFWEFSIEQARLQALPAGLRWEFLDASPFLPTGPSV